METETEIDVLTWAAHSIKVGFGDEQQTLGSIFNFDDIIGYVKEEGEMEK